MGRFRRVQNVWEKGGGVAQADEDFKNMKLTNVRTDDGITKREFSNGSTVSIYQFSSDGRVTIQINFAGSSNYAKIRYAKPTGPR
jgi:hypothetical protein